jgi:hypothetical protein
MSEQSKTIFLLATGCYSDYANEVYMALRPFTFRQLDLEFRAQWVKEPDDWRDGPDNQSFIDFGIKAGYFQPFPCVEIHLGEYSSYEMDIADAHGLTFEPATPPKGE